MFLDIGIGILLSIWTSCFFHSDLTFTLVFAGIAFALLPDIDFFIEFFKHFFSFHRGFWNERSPDLGLPTC